MDERKQPKYRVYVKPRDGRILTKQVKGKEVWVEWGVLWERDNGDFDLALNPDHPPINFTWTKGDNGRARCSHFLNVQQVRKRDELF